MAVPLNIDWQQILLHLFNFVILGVGLYLLLYSPVKRFMDQRTAYYQELEQQASAHLAQAEQLEADYTRRLAAVRQEIEAQRQEADAELAAERQAVRAQAEAEADRLLSAARAKAEAERRRLLDDSRQEVADLALNAAGQLAGQTLTEQRQRELLDDILQKVGESRVG